MSINSWDYTVQIKKRMLETVNCTNMLLSSSGVSDISTFWTNTIWYIALGAATAAELIVVFVRVEKRKLAVAFFLTVFGVALFVESTLLIFMKSYTYFPTILHTSPNPYDDVLAGNLFSQTSISATLLLAVVLRLKKYWYFIFAGLYGLIETLFVHLGIYSQNWYQTWITVAMLPPAFWLIKYMYEKISRKGIKPALYLIYIVLGLFPLNIVTLNWCFMLTGIQDMSFRLLPDPIMSRHFIVLILFFTISLSMLLLHFTQMKRYWKTLIVMALFILYYCAYRSGFILIRDGWFILVSALTIFWMYFSTVLLDRLYGRPLITGFKS